MSGCPRETRRARRGEQRGKVEMPFEMIGETFENAVDYRLIADAVTTAAVALGAEPGQEGAAEPVGSKNPVQVTTGDAAVGADRAVRPSAEIEHWAGKAGT